MPTRRFGYGRGGRSTSASSSSSVQCKNEGNIPIVKFLKKYKQQLMQRNNTNYSFVVGKAIRGVMQHETLLCNRKDLEKVKGIGITIASLVAEKIDLPNRNDDNDNGSSSSSSNNEPRRVWTTEEDQIILEVQARIGNRWAKIAKMLDGRTHNDV